MKNSISHIISFISMILITSFVLLIVFEISIRSSVLIKNMDNTYYYKSANENIILNLDKNITNNNIKNIYKSYITEDRIRNDIIKIMGGKSVSHYNELYRLLSEYSYSEEVCVKSANVINDIYFKNIFPIREYKLIRKGYISTKLCISYLLVLMSLIIILQLGLYIINNNFKYNKISILSSSILSMFPFLFVNVSGIFKNIIYTNNYYTYFLINIGNSVINYLFIMGLTTLLIIFILYKKSKK